MTLSIREMRDRELSSGIIAAGTWQPSYSYGIDGILYILKRIGLRAYRALREVGLTHSRTLTHASEVK